MNHYLRKHKLSVTFIGAFILALVISSLVYATLSFIAMSHGDINHDGVIDNKDSAILAHHSKGDLVVSDLNNDGVVDAEDVQILMSEWSNKATYTKAAASASTASPSRVVTKPLVVLQ